MLIINDFPWATHVLPLGWNIQEGILHTPLFFIFVAVLGQGGADLKPDMTWLVNLSLLFSQAAIAAAAAHFTGSAAPAVLSRVEAASMEMGEASPCFC